MTANTINLNDRYMRMQDALPAVVTRVRDYAIFLLDPCGIILTWNPAAETMKGYSASEAIGNHLGMLYTEEGQRNGHPQHNLHMAAINGTYQEECWRRRKDGSLFWAMIELIAIHGSDQTLHGFCKITRDLTDRKLLQDQLTREKQRAELTLGAIGEGVISVDTQGNIDFINPKAEELTGWRYADAIGRPFEDVFHAVDEQSGSTHEHQLISWLQAGHVPRKSTAALLISQHGTQRPVEDTAAPIIGPDGKIDGGVVVFRDVTKAKQLLDAATHAATHDPLTGLVNKIKFKERLNRTLERARRNNTSGALLCMDLDRFKIINDTCGHQAGDEVLVQLSTLYRSLVRERDTIGRLGGDEFALIIDRCTPDEGMAVANKLLQSTASFQYVCKGRAFQVGVSIGMVMFDGAIGNPEEILLLADHASYVAKQRGRHQVYFHHPEESVVERRRSDIDWIPRLTEAMRLDQMSLCYQTITDTDGAHSHGIEILLRMTDEYGIEMLPSAFLPAAERFALMPTIDRWVVRRVLDWMAQTQDVMARMTLCSINLSRHSVADDSFPQHLAKMLHESRVPPGMLCFEISDATIDTDLHKGRSFIENVRALGCRVSLGDFGSGVGSFMHLKQLPVDYIKIAPSLSQGTATDGIDKEIVRAINEIAHLVGCKTVAQWVEDEATMHVLGEIGADYLQGHWISRPQKLDELQRWCLPN